MHESAAEVREERWGLQKGDVVYHVMVLSHSACGPQGRIQLRSQVNRIFANDNTYFVNIVMGFYCADAIFVGGSCTGSLGAAPPDSPG